MTIVCVNAKARSDCLLSRQRVRTQIADLKAGVHEVIECLPPLKLPLH